MFVALTSSSSACLPSIEWHWHRYLSSCAMQLSARLKRNLLLPPHRKQSCAPRASILEHCHLPSKFLTLAAPPTSNPRSRPSIPEGAEADPWNATTAGKHGTSAGKKTQRAREGRAVRQTRRPTAYVVGVAHSTINLSTSPIPKLLASRRPTSGFFKTSEAYFPLREERFTIHNFRRIPTTQSYKNDNPNKK